MPSPEATPNEALQQTRSALTTIAAALAAERRCWAEILRTESSPDVPSTGFNGYVHHVVGTTGLTYGS